jgi:hypothetical protein
LKSLIFNRTDLDLLSPKQARHNRHSKRGEQQGGDVQRVAAACADGGADWRRVDSYSTNAAPTKVRLGAIKEGALLPGLVFVDSRFFISFLFFSFCFV